MSTTPITSSQALAAALEAEIPEERIARVLGEALGATVTTRAGTIEPDHKIRLAAAQLALHYKHGRPVERQEIMSVSLEADNSVGLKERIRHSPALRKLLADALREAGSEPVDV